MRWLGLIVLLAACGQDDSYYQDPTPKNLGKPPYDFAAEKFPRDFSATAPDDLGGEVDMSVVEAKHDLSKVD